MAKSFKNGGIEETLKPKKKIDQQQNIDDFSISGSEFYYNEIDD